MDVVTIEKTNEHFRVLFDVKGRFILRSINAEEAKLKLCKIKRREVGPNKVPYIVTNDGRTLRYPHPNIKVNDTVQLDIATNTVKEVVPFEVGNLAYIQSGNNVGRIGTVTVIDSHPGSFDIVHVKDAKGHSFSTRFNH